MLTAGFWLLTYAATQRRHHPGNIHAFNVLGRRSSEGFSLSPQDAIFHEPSSQENAFCSRVHSIHKRRCFSVAAYSTESIVLVVETDTQKEGTHAKRRINALHISILVQPDDYRWLENSGENLHILVKDSE